MKILGHEFFGSKAAESAPAPAVTPDPNVGAQRRLDLIQSNLNTLTAGRDMEAGSGTPNVDATQIEALRTEKAALEATGVVPTVAPVESKARFENTPTPMQMNRVAEGKTPDPTPESLKTTAQLVEQLNRDVGVNTQPVPTPIRSEAPSQSAAPVTSVNKAA